jgi:hypothetical protein
VAGENVVIKQKNIGAKLNKGAGINEVVAPINDLS